MLIRSEGGRSEDMSSPGIFDYWMLVAGTVDQADSETRNQKKKRHMYKQLLSNENTL